MNKTFRATLLLCFFVLGGFTALLVWSGNTQAAETGVWKGFYAVSDDMMFRATTTYWPDVNSSEALVSFQPLWGPPSGIWSTTFYDDDLDGQAIVAEVAGDRTYIDPDGYEVDDLGDGQLSLYRCELDGTTDAITQSVWSIDIFFWIEDSDWRGTPQ